MIEAPERLTTEYVASEVAPLFDLCLTACRMREETYLANHSLGRPLDRMEHDVHDGLALWYARMDHSWYDDDGWMGEMNLWRSNTARLLGLSTYDCVVPKVSAGQGLRAVLNALIGERKVRVVATTGEFDSIDFILRTYALRGVIEVTWVAPSSSENGVPLFSANDIAAAIAADTDLVVFSRVFFTTAQVLAGHTKIVEAAHAHGALVVCDLFHAAGVIPVEMEKEGYDFAIGGSYKYLRGGPGACWLAVHPKTFDKRLRSLDTGWFAKADHFGFQRADAEPEFKDRGDGWLESTPAVILPYQAKAGLEFALDIGVPRMRAFVLERLAKMRSVFKSHGVDLHSPNDPSQFGNFALMPHPDPAGLWKRLLEKGINVDARQGFVRFGPDLLNTDEDFETAAKTVKSLL